MGRGQTLAVDLVILDEAHFLGDADRGVVWEEIMIYLPPRIPLLMLSAHRGQCRRNRPVAVGPAPTPLRGGGGNPAAGSPVADLSPPGRHPHAPAGRHIGQETGPALQKGQRLPAPGPAAPHGPAGKASPPLDRSSRSCNRFDLLPAIFFLKSRADCDRALALCSDPLPWRPGQARGLAEEMDRLARSHPHIARHRQRRHLEDLGVGAHHHAASCRPGNWFLKT